MSDETPQHGASESAYSASDAASTNGAASMARRLRRLERTLGVRFEPNTNEVFSHDAAIGSDSEQQASELLQAFRQISDDKIRQQLLDIVKAAIRP